jgi:hypothetical protein
MSYQKIVLLTVCVATILTVGYMAVFSPTENNESPLRISGLELNELRVVWQERIDAIGPAEAYTEFKASISDSVVDSHTLVHVFGEALYATQGLAGIGTCDGSFAFGCYHSFFGVAVHEHGLEVLPEFDAACRTAYGEYYLPCQHGIGHGVLVYTGYDDLVSALDLCATISTHPTGGCVSGVFMEYNFHTMDDTVPSNYHRPITEDIYAPCTSLGKQYQPACYQEQVQWWQSVFNSDFQHIGTLCAALERDSDNWRTCYYGVGNYVAADSSLQPEKITSQCALMPDQETTALCHTGAAWLVRASGEGMSEAERVCTLSPASWSETCFNTL